MSKKKHIDELFKEQLQNFEAAPSPEVWNNIQAKMKKEKEDRKVIPIWWKLGGVAAVLALLLALNFVFQPFIDDNTTDIVTEDKVKTDSEGDITPVLEDITTNEDQISSEDDGSESIDNEVDNNSITDDAKNTLKDKIVNESQKNRKAVAIENDNKADVPQKSDALIKKNRTVEAIDKKDAVVEATSDKNIDKKEIKDRNPLIKKEVSEGVAKKVIIGVAKVTDKKDDVNPEIDNKTVEPANPLIKKEDFRIKQN